MTAVSICWGLVVGLWLLRHRPSADRVRQLADRAGRPGLQWPTWVIERTGRYGLTLPPLSRAKVVVAGGGAVGSLLLAPQLTLLGVVAGVGLVVLRQRRQRARALRRLRGDLPEAITIVRIGLDAGATPVAALGHSISGAGAARPAFQRVVDRVERGSSWAEAVDALDELGPVARPLRLALLRADGGGISADLARLTDDLLDEHRRDLEARARRLPVQLLAPLVLCVLPAFLLLTVVPVVLELASSSLAELP